MRVNRSPAASRAKALRPLFHAASIISLCWGTDAFAQVAVPTDGLDSKQTAQPPQTAPVVQPEDGEIVVTGSRIASPANDSPTPLTVIYKDQLTATTPRDIPDGLNKLPIFQGGQQPRRPGPGGSNEGSNQLALRGLGAARTLVLLDGHRLTPANANGTVNADTIPQMLISRVDVVTGGASAVYGSDAVSGVVNFILDTKFTGLKANANAGISTYGDAPRYKVGIAAGLDVGSRGHFIASYEHRYSDSLKNTDRPYGDDYYVQTGAGTAANPFRSQINTRRADSTFGGKITYCSSPCPANGQQFLEGGVLGPFVPGAKSGSTNLNQGGDGAYSLYSYALVETRNDEGFARFDYEIADKVNLFLQGSYAESFNTGFAFTAKLTPGTGSKVSQASYFFKNNPFLSATTQAALGNNGKNDASNLFSIGEYITSTGPEGLTGVRGFNNNINLKAGLNGALGRLRWNLYYTHGVNNTRVENLFNSNYQKQFAALDAVVGPNGTVQCYAATQAATAAAYADCVPLNAFGPTAITQDAFNYFTQTTVFDTRNKLDDVGGSLTGEAFDNWAGPVQFAISAEARRSSYKVTSNASPSAVVDCTGLRICSPTLPLWAASVSPGIDVSNAVYEGAGELLIPLLADKSFAENLSLSLAGRYTHYSTSGSITSWKAGVDYRVNEDIRFRGTASRDIRAPTLNDLFSPIRVSATGFSDQHTGVSNTLFSYTQGNSNLKPETARTYTIGMVLTPQAVPRLSVSLDFYQVRLNNAITGISATNVVVQKLCEDSNGSSIYCTLYDRPLPFSDRSPANFPTRIFSLSLNSAVREIRGYDLEGNYRFSKFGGMWTARLLANYQPTNSSLSFPGAATTFSEVPKVQITAFLNLDLGDIGIALQNRWLSRVDKVSTEGQVYEDRYVRPFNSLDMNIENKFHIAGKQVTGFISVENIFNAQPEAYATSSSVGQNYPVLSGADILGRYFTAGIRTQF